MTMLSVILVGLVSQSHVVEAATAAIRDCPKETIGIKSTAGPSGQPVKTLIVMGGQPGVEGQISWVDFEGNEKPFSGLDSEGNERPNNDLPAISSPVSANTFVGNVWRVRGADGRLLEEFTVSKVPKDVMEVKHCGDPLSFEGAKGESEAELAGFKKKAEEERLAPVEIAPAPAPPPKSPAGFTLLMVTLGLCILTSILIKKMSGDGGKSCRAKHIQMKSEEENQSQILPTILEAKKRTEDGEGFDKVAEECKEAKKADDSLEDGEGFDKVAEECKEAKKADDSLKDGEGFDKVAEECKEAKKAYDSLEEIDRVRAALRAKMLTGTDEPKQRC